MPIIVVPTFNFCERPNCPGEPQPEFVNYPISSSHLLTIPVEWRILNNSTPSSTEIYYSLNDPSLNQKVSSSPTRAYYDGASLFSDIPIQFETGTLYMRAQAVINGSIYYSKIETITIQTGGINCFPAWRDDPTTTGDRVTDIYIEFRTRQDPDQIQVLGNYDSTNCTGDVLYDTGCVSTLPHTDFPDAYPPTKFNPNAKLHAGRGLYINNTDVWYDCFQAHSSDFPLGVRISPNCEDTTYSRHAVKILGPDFELYNEDNTGTQTPYCVGINGLTATVHYQTYSIKDWIVVYSGEAPDPCLDPRDTEGLLWESGCVGTSDGEGPGNSGGDYGAGGRVDTFAYTTADVPFTVSVIPNCENTTGTAWCATVYYDDGSVAFSDCGDDTAVCDTPSLYYCIGDTLAGTCSCATEESGDPNFPTLSVHDTQEECEAACICVPALLGDQWIQMADTFNSQGVVSGLVSHPNGDIYGGTAFDHGGPEPITGGRLFRYTPGDTGWTELAGQLNGQYQIRAGVYHEGYIYMATYPSGHLFRYAPGDSVWTEVASSLGPYVNSLAVHDGYIYGGAASGSGARLFRYTPGVFGWTDVVDTLWHNGQSGIHSLLSHSDGYLYAGTSGGDGGNLFRYSTGDSEWTTVVPQFSSQDLVLSLAEHPNGDIYGGTGTGGSLFRYTQGASVWEEEADMLSGEGYIHSLLYHGGLIVGGTGNNLGRLYKHTPEGSVWDGAASSKHNQEIVESLISHSDGYVYGSTSPGGKLFRWDFAPAFDSIGHIDELIGSAKKVWGDGTTIFLANGTDGLRAYTFNGTTFTPVGHVPTLDSTVNVWGDGTYIYASNKSDGLRVYTHNKIAKTFNEVGHQPTGIFNFTLGAWADSNYVYVANSGDQLAYTFSEGGGFNLVGSRDTYFDSISDVWGDGTYIYFNNGLEGISAWTFNGSNFIYQGDDINDFDDNASMGHNNKDFWSDGNQFYIARGPGASASRGISAYVFEGSPDWWDYGGDIQEGPNPASANGVWSDGTYIYLANGNDGIRSYSYNGSTDHFASVGHFNDGGDASGVWGDGTYIYLANGVDGLRAYTFGAP